MKMIERLACIALGLAIATAPLSAGALATEKGKVEKPAKPAKNKKTQPKKPALRKGYRGGIFNQPVYNPATKSYFELVMVNPKNPAKQIEWPVARRRARRLVWKGVHGRLAIVKSRRTHDFLRDTFRSPLMAWIGLRYMCGYNTLIWVTGQIQPRGGFSYWDPVWNIDGTPVNRTNYRTRNCPSKTSFWPIHYWPSWRGFLWNANGQHKGANAFFVEFPTGKR